MKKLLRSIKISPFTVIFFLILLFSGNLKTGLLAFLMLFIHELGHILMILILKYEIRVLKIYPYGCSIELMNGYIRNYFDDLLISSAGPLMYFIGNMIINLLSYYSLVSVLYINYLHSINLNICIFNCLPLLPLDGGRCLVDLISLMINERVGVITTRLISIIIPMLFIFKSSIWFKVFFVYIIYFNILELFKYNDSKNYRNYIEKQIKF